MTAMLFSIQAQAIYFDDDGIEQGYRGFADFSYSLGVGDFAIDRVGITTSHGYQIAPQFFAGAGVGVNYFYDSDWFNVPIFAEFRSDILNSDITPFADVRVGYAVGDVKGFYLNPSVGCRFSLSDDMGFNVSIGYTMQKCDILWNSSWSYLQSRENMGCIDFKIGIDF